MSDFDFDLEFTIFQNWYRGLTVEKRRLLYEILTHENPRVRVRKERMNMFRDMTVRAISLRKECMRRARFGKGAHSNA